MRCSGGRRWRVSAGFATRRQFNQFIELLLNHVGAIAPEHLFLEMGKQNLTGIVKRMEATHKVVVPWEITYYKRHKSYVVYGGGA